MRATVLGAGAWGTALGMVLAGKGHQVTIWSHEDDVAASINAGTGNRYLAGVTLPAGLRAETDLPAAVAGAEVVVSASPAQFVRAVMTGAASDIAPDAQLVSASKGIELGSLQRMDEVLSQVLPDSIMDRFCVLSGPSFAAEVAADEPTAVVIASRDEQAAVYARDVFLTPTFRVYTNADVIGVELGGALKNVVALAAGVSAGLGYGHNTLAALITRGLAEITRLGVAAGAEKATFYGLAGIGDLVLTCTGSLSRNRTVGYRLGQGETLEAILSDMTAVAEGVQTAEAVRELAGRHGVEMPIMEQMYAIVHEGRSPSDALRTLMSREPKTEEWS
ncbi:MAG: NAD(P)-dependent glycerol-3-phosphate dehydrogenase [Gemmatimonadota bacterium]|nr:NAD(P)-dependent glycerol-3-phosphate dehydrogenase [Gemmatimonadota bacterium]MDH3421974.1 NAD(P)-dependent glycerol-3-phosphate dehydrogenase [Gemmatimonadota bacterium]